MVLILSFLLRAVSEIFKKFLESGGVSPRDCQQKCVSAGHSTQDKTG